MRSGRRDRTGVNFERRSGEREGGGVVRGGAFPGEGEVKLVLLGAAAVKKLPTVFRPEQEAASPSAAAPFTPSVCTVTRARAY